MSIVDDINKMPNVSLQKDIGGAYEELLVILNKVGNSISGLHGICSQFNAVKNEISSTLNAKIFEVRNEMENTLNDSASNHKLVIAFFGETGAGKSAIIETFRILFDKNRKKEDGLIVGRGEPDCTKSCQEYDLAISGYPFTLIDVPGIEGDEEKFKDSISAALKKAHCVFYVHGHNAKPNVATAEKIKNYLGNQVKVYSVYNVRDSIGKYDEEEERETLLTDNVLKVEKEVKDVFKMLLGDVYEGHVTLQALLAMLSKAEFSVQRDDFIRNQQRLLLYFENPDTILRFSQFGTLVDLVASKASNYESEIVEANKQRMISLAYRIEDEIKSVFGSQKENLTRLSSGLQNVKRYFKYDFSANNVVDKCNFDVDKSYDELKNEIYKLIEVSPKNIKYVADYRQKLIMDEFEHRILSDIQIGLKKIEEEAKHRIKDLYSPCEIEYSLENNVRINVHIDFAGAMEMLDKDLLKCAADVLECAASGAVIGAPFGGLLGSGIGAGAGGLLGLVKISRSKEGKAKARKSVADAIVKSKQSAIQNVKNVLTPISGEIEAKKKKVLAWVNEDIVNIKTLDDSLECLEDEINGFVSKLKHTQYGRI